MYNQDRQIRVDDGGSVQIPMSNNQIKSKRSE